MLKCYRTIIETSGIVFRHVYLINRFDRYCRIISIEGFSYRETVYIGCRFLLAGYEYIFLMLFLFYQKDLFICIGIIMVLLLLVRWLFVDRYGVYIFIQRLKLYNVMEIPIVIVKIINVRSEQTIILT